MCIGLQKAGTGWLYDQLDAHPDFAMPPIKELHYFDHGLRTATLRNIERRVHRDADKLNAWRMNHNRRPLTSADMEFISRVIAARDEEADIDRYAALFRGHALTGDITPAYSTLSNEKVDLIASRFPALKVVLLLREPTSRVASHLGMMVRLGKLPKEMLDTPGAVAEWLAKPEVQGRSRPSQTWLRWSRRFPRGQARFFFFDQLCERPDTLIADIIRFLGGDPHKAGGLAPDHNRKGSAGMTIAPEVRAVLDNAMRDETEACARIFGGPARQWASRLKSQARSSTRP